MTDNNKISDDRLADIWFHSQAEPMEISAIAQELQSLRRSSSRGVVKVKKLDWKGNDDQAFGSGAGFVYTVRSPDISPGWRVWVEIKDKSGMGSVGGTIVTMRAANLIDAMDAANEDYERRILSAIEQEQAEPVQRERHGETGYGYDAHPPSPPEIDEGRKAIDLTEKNVSTGARAIYESGPSIGGDTEGGWEAQSEGYKHKARAVAHVVIAALSPEAVK